MSALRAAFKDLIHKRPQLILFFAVLLTVAWLALLAWASSGIVGLI